MRIYQVNAFADAPFKGNSAGVCIMEDPCDDDFLKNIAAEMKLSETAFLWQLSANHFKLRWFTPETEVSLCGHATLASAHILWENDMARRDCSIFFDTMSGPLAANINEEWIELDFPRGNLSKSTGDQFLFEAFTVTPKAVYEDDIVYLLEFDSEETIQNLEPDFGALIQAKKEEIIVTSKASNTGYDFVSRFFGPAIGVDEDPVTGSSHCYLAPFWSERLDKSELLGYQASKRTGFVKCKVNGERVTILGKAVTFLSGTLL